MIDISEVAQNLVLGPGYADALVESFYVAPREGRFAPIPPHLLSPDTNTKRWIESEPNFGKGKMWLHQANALNAAFSGKNVVVMTSTGSGKTEIIKGQALYTLDKDPNSTVIALYPTKALQTDQAQTLRAAFKAAGLGENSIGIINGDTDYGVARLDILRQSKVLLTTPDIVHSWLLQGLKEPGIKDFVKRLNLIGIDEAHLYSGVLGTQAHFLFRRLEVARDALRNQSMQYPNDSRIRIVAASATLRDAKGFMERLTGHPFVEIGSIHDGSQKYTQDVVHIGVGEGQEHSLLRKFVLDILNEKQPGQMSGTGICFIDSRAAVERLASEINGTVGSQLIRPYRGSYSQSDRNAIDFEMRTGGVRFVFATSALEQGINIPDMSLGVCVGVPNQPGALHQRLGRVGRGKPEI